MILANGKNLVIKDFGMANSPLRIVFEPLDDLRLGSFKNVLDLRVSVRFINKNHTYTIAYVFILSNKKFGNGIMVNTVS